jgi:phage-related protein
MAWDALWKYTIEGLTKARDWILGLISGLWNSIIGGLKDARSWLINVGKDIINGLWDGIKTAWTGAWDWLTGLAKLVTSAVGDIGNILYDAGHAIFEGFLNGLKAAWNDVTGFVGSVGGWIASHKGPLDYDRQLLIPHGNAVMAGFNEGLTTGFAKAQLNISGMAKKLSQSVQVDGLGGIYGLGSRSNALTPGGVTIINNNTMQPNQDMTSFAAVVSRTTARSMR